MPCEFYLDRQKFRFPDGSLGFLFCPSKAKTKTTNILKLNRLSSNTTWLWFIFVLLQSSFLLFYFFFYFYWISAFSSVREEIGKSKIRDDPEGWYREGEGRRVQDGEHVDTWGGFMLIYGKTNTIL